MPTTSFIVDPTNTEVSTYSVWTMSLKVNIPLMPHCWIEMFLPPEFGYDRDTMLASGMFMRESLTPQLFDEDINIIFRNGADIPKSSVFFNGCNFEPALGREPFGRLDISYISTQAQLKDSDTFEIKIFKDEAKTMLIAELEDGVVVKAGAIQPGAITGMSITPDNFAVQKTTSLTFKFTVTNLLPENSAVTIRLPTGIVTPIEGTILTDVSSPDGSSQATTAVVLAGNMI